MSSVEEHDLNKLHYAAMREREEPFEGREPVPLWMSASFILLIAWGGWYLGRYDAHFEASRADMQPVAVAGAPAEAETTEPAEDGPSAERGAALFSARCAACHQGNGEGMAGLAPTLAGSDWVAGDEERLIRVVLHGLTGPIVVSGEPFEGSMPPWGPSMSDAEIADVLTYVRSAWSNDASPIDEAQVQAVRSGSERSAPWTAEEL